MTAKKRLERTGVMLATQLDDKLLSNYPTINFLQPKLNGERCRAEWDESSMRHILYSSYGKIFLGLDHITTQLRDMFPGESVDGELYVHGWTRERIHSTVSRKRNPHKDAQLMEYHVFDTIDCTYPQWARIKFINHPFTKSFSRSPVKLVPTMTVYKKDIAREAQTCVLEGFEGVILRHYEGLYETKRSRFLAKFKPSKTDRYLIIGSIEEVDKEGYPKNTLGALKVQDHSGNIFNVGTGNALTKLSRKHLWERRSSLPGRFAVVKHSLIYTVGGFPTCTSLVEVE